MATEPLSPEEIRALTEQLTETTDVGDAETVGPSEEGRAMERARLERQAEWEAAQNEQLGEQIGQKLPRMHRTVSDPRPRCQTGR